MNKSKYLPCFPGSILMDTDVSRLGQLNESWPSGDLIDCQMALGGSYKLVWSSVVSYIVKCCRMLLRGTIWYCRGRKWHLQVDIVAKHRQITLALTPTTDSIARESCYKTPQGGRLAGLQ